MPHRTANFIVQLHGYDTSCTQAVTDSLIKNSNKKGKLWAAQMMESAVSGEKPVVYTSNGPTSAWSAARHMMLSGARVAVFEVASDGSLTQMSIES